MRRVGENIRAVLAETLLIGSHHIPEIDGKLVTIIEVLPSSDLRTAKVYIGALGGNEKETAKLLNTFAGKFSSLVAKKMKTKFSPRLIFMPDDSYERIKKIDNLIKSTETR